MDKHNMRNEHKHNGECLDCNVESKLVLYSQRGQGYLMVI